MNSQTSDTLKITVPLVSDLITEQFPQWAHLSIKPIKSSGHDNRTFHLGKKMIVRLPSAEQYAPQVQKEQTWLPILAQHLSISIPKPLAMGQPSKNYPWNWSVYKWIEGESANALCIDESKLQLHAIHLAQFLNQLHKINTLNAPLPGSHNFYRGDSPLVYDTQTRSAINQLHNYIDTERANAVWQKATSSTWNKKSVWVHGDLTAENILIKNNKLTAVIDFGCMAIGDPACDLVIAWTFFKNKSRNIFKSHLPLDSCTWDRARGWALLKALIKVSPLKDKKCPEAVKQFNIINELD